MTRRTLLIGTGTIVSFALASCNGAPSSTPTAPPTAARTASRADPRSGALHVRKDCSLYTGRAGDSCTITASSLEQIAVGSKVVYASDASFPRLDTDVVLDPPGPGDNVAFGHCTLSLETGVGACRFSGGRGKFIHFAATVDVSYLGGPDYAWNGTYSFDGNGVDH